MKIIKFGGSSISNAKRIKNVIEIVEDKLQKRQKIIVVFSAFENVTDELLNVGGKAEQKNIKYKEKIAQLSLRHAKMSKQLLKGKLLCETLEKIEEFFSKVYDIACEIYLTEEFTNKRSDLLLSFGEQLSTFIITKAFQQKNINADYLDTRFLIKTNSNFGFAKVAFYQTSKNLQKYFKNSVGLQIVTGFIASNRDNQITTLGRGGSDYTASIIASALEAKEIEIWTDVDGVMTADPKKVFNALPLSELSYKESFELSHFGAKVIHSPTIKPAIDKQIPIIIKNTFRPEFLGTKISSNPEEHPYLVSGITSLFDVVLLRIEGDVVTESSGVLGRLFEFFDKQKIDTLFISQASSNHSICIAVSLKDLKKAQEVIEKEFVFELKARLLEPLIVEDDISIVSLIGEKIKQNTKFLAVVFESLANSNIDVIDVVQGASKLSISIIVAKIDQKKAVQVLHEVFFEKENKNINIFIVGTGLIGTELLNQIKQEQKKLQRVANISVNVCGIANSRNNTICENGMNLKSWEDCLKGGDGGNIESFLHSLKNIKLSNKVLVDCTASEKIPGFYKKFLENNISIVTPNKKANSNSFRNFQTLQKLGNRNKANFFYETNVGAGLPIIETLKNLIKTGDTILKIEGVLSGTLSYLFNSFTENKKFSQIVKQAQEKGYTEPDPRNDLNGLDVARKILILAREVGLDLEMKDVEVENLVPQKVSNAKSVEEFFLLLEGCDNYFDGILKKATKAQKKLCYIATLESEKISVKLKSISKDHPFSSIDGSDNIVSFTTERYKNNPLIIRGPGAGASVTAAGVFADILKCI